METHRLRVLVDDTQENVVNCAAAGFITLWFRGRRGDPRTVATWQEVVERVRRVAEGAGEEVRGWMAFHSIVIRMAEDDVANYHHSYGRR
jgi:hypothetical protein